MAGGARPRSPWQGLEGGVDAGPVDQMATRNPAGSYSRIATPDGGVLEIINGQAFLNGQPMYSQQQQAQSPEAAYTQKMLEMQGKKYWSSQPTRNQMIPSHSVGADMKSYETRKLLEDFWRNPENVKTAKDIYKIK